MNQEAIRLKTAAGIHTLYHNSLNAARIAQGRGDLAKAEELYQQAMKNAVSDPDVIWNAHAGLGALAIDQHRQADAVRHFEAAVNSLEQTRAGYSGAEMKLAGHRGSAPVPGAGEGVSPSRTFLSVFSGRSTPRHLESYQSSFRRDAETSTRDECAPRSPAARALFHLIISRMTDH